MYCAQLPATFFTNWMWRWFYLKHRGKAQNSATFNSGHDTKSGVWPLLFLTLEWHSIAKMMGISFVMIYTKDDTCNPCGFPGILPLIKNSHGFFVGFSLPIKILQKIHGIFSSMKSNIPPLPRIGENFQ